MPEMTLIDEFLVVSFDIALISIDILLFLDSSVGRANDC
tara:strand:+ start:39715 stop:39831 length:117 start_codon:yes stop_codon:yes gene_type:complete